MAYPETDPTDFDILDANDDRMLNFEEANTGEAAALFDGLERAEAAADGMSMVMAEFDTDADGMMSYEEISKRIPGVPEAYFQDFDIDSSGMIDSAEMNSGAFQNLLDKYGS